MMNASFNRCVIPGFLIVACWLSAAKAGDEISTSTPAEFVATYDSLATAILAIKQTEENLVRSILSTTFAHANAARARAERAMKSGDKPQSRAALEELAVHVALLGNEGDNAVAGIRKRLVEGGHHHNSVGESQGVYAPGFVIVTRVARQKFLESSRVIAQLSRDPDEESLAGEWTKVKQVWEELAKQKK
jgi:hypothetical protein